MINRTHQSTAKCPSSQQLQNADQRARLVHLFAKSEEGRDSKIAVQRELGETWGQYKNQIRRTPGMTIERSLREHPLGFSQQHANGCERLFKAYAQYEAANQWYQQSGIGLGWQTVKQSGWEYALQVIALHTKSLNGESPDTKPSTANKKPKRTHQELEDTKLRLKELENDHSVLKEDYAKLEQEYLAAFGRTEDSGAMTQLATPVQAHEEAPHAIVPASVSTKKIADKAHTNLPVVAAQSGNQKRKSSRNRVDPGTLRPQKVLG